MNVLSNWGGQLVALTLGFFAAPFIVGRLGNSAYGVWMLTVALAGYLGLLDLGVRGGVTRYVAKFSASGNNDEASRTASAALHLYLALGVVVTLVAALVAMFGADRLGIPPEHLVATRTVLVLTGLTVAVSLVSGTFGGVIAALQRFELLNLAEVAIGVARTVATVLALLAGHGIVAMALIQFLLSVIRGIWLVWLTGRLYPALRITHYRPDRTQLRLILSFSLVSFVLHVSGRVIYYTDALVIGAFLPIGLLTLFAIGSGLVEYARALTSGISFTTTPMASSLDGAGEHERVRTLLTTSAKFSMIILLPVAVTFLIRGSSFIGLWMGSSYAETSGRILAILSLPLLFHAGAHGIGGILLGIGKHKPLVPAMLAEAAVNLGLSVVLVQTMGIAGVAWGTTLPSIASAICFWPWYAARAVGLPAWEYITLVWIRPWLATVPFALGTIAVEHFWPAGTLVVFFVQVAVCLVLAVGTYWWVCFSRPDREEIVAAVQRRIQGSLPASA